MTTRPSSSIQWGRVTLHLNDLLFLQGCAGGREYYFISCVETPRRACRLTASDILLLVTASDAGGHYHFDSEPFPLEQRLGFVFGFLSGPLFPDPDAAAWARERYRQFPERELSPEQLASPAFQWGCVTLYLDQRAFAAGYQDGRDCYYESCLDLPAHAHSLTDESLLRTIAYPDGEHYRLDEAEQVELDNSLGFFVGYLSGPLLEQTPEERARCAAEVQA
jgi:hypothetical protein